MHRIFILTVALLCNSLAYADCEDMVGGSTGHESCLLSIDIQNTEKSMKVLIKKIESRFEKWPQPEYSKQVLNLSQESWVYFRNKQCEFEQHLFGGIHSISFMRCELRMNEQRINELEEYYHAA